MSEHIVNIDETNAAALLIEESYQRPVVVDFWADWCGPCKMMAPAFQAAAADIEPAARLVKLDTEAHPGIASRYHIRSIPTLIVFRRGRETARISGALDRSGLTAWIRQQL